MRHFYLGSQPTIIRKHRLPMTQATSSFTVYPSLDIGVTQLIGQDNKTFLQGQLTCDLDTLSQHHSVLGAHCDAKGKMLAILRLIQSDDSVLALQVADNTAGHLPSLKKYAVFSKVEINDLSTELECTGLSGQDALAWANTLTEKTLNDECDTIATAFGLISSFPIAHEDVPRLVIISDAAEQQLLSNALAQLPLTQATNNDWQRLEILTATPQLSAKLQAEHVPQMLNMQMVNGISFKKGCYIGQETVARMHYRGLNKRAMFILSSPSHIRVQVGDNLERQIGDNWRNAGTIVSVSSAKESTVACAILPTDIELDSQLRVKNEESEGQFSITTPTYFDA